ncbi:hypothetical protein Clacol_000279 [Clathrus columnatus]|uniref:F-box domain-containing protein n=1 Tax=Clathrus columnatus TaxID=1419009 RepID=A0AAV4ZWW6_9AGAM|nr:hypothetical protein Clacol_000279 [Clathrus columnatus]
MDLPPELLLKIFEFIAIPTSNLPLPTLARLSLVNRQWRSIATSFLYTSILHKGWKLRRVAACLETLALDRDALSAIKERQITPESQVDIKLTRSSRSSAESERTTSTLQGMTIHQHQVPNQNNSGRQHPRNLSNSPSILNSPSYSNTLAATVQHLHFRLWSPDSDNALSQLLVHALSNTTNLLTLNLSMSEIFAQHLELHLLRTGIIALESPSEPQPTLLARSFLPHLNALDISPGFRLFQLASGRPIHTVSSSTHIMDDALKHLVPFFQRSLGPVKKVHFNVTARDTNAVAQLLRVIAWKLPCLVEVFFNFFVSKRGHPPYSPELLELLAPLSALQTVEILLSRHARSVEPDPYLYQHFAALHTLKATAPNVKHVVLDTIRWMYTSAGPSPTANFHANVNASTKSSVGSRVHVSSSMTPPPISPISISSLSHSPPSSDGPSTPPSTGVGMTKVVTTVTKNGEQGPEQEQEQMQEGQIVSLPTTFQRQSTPSSPSQTYTLSSPINPNSVIDIPTPKSTASFYPPSPYSGTPNSYAPLTASGPPRIPLTPTHPLTPRSPNEFFQTPISPGSFGSPDAGMEEQGALSPIYTGWSPLPSDQRTHMWWLSTYGNAVDARLAMCAMWGGILRDPDAEADLNMVETEGDNMKEFVDILNVIPPLEEIGYMFGYDMASAAAVGVGAPGFDMFAVDMHSNSPHADHFGGGYDIEELV